MAGACGAGKGSGRPRPSRHAQPRLPPLAGCAPHQRCSIGRAYRRTPSFPWWPQDPTGRAFQLCTARPLPERKLSNPHRCPEEGEASRGRGARLGPRAPDQPPRPALLTGSQPTAAQKDLLGLLNTYHRSQKGTSGHLCSVSGQNTESEEKEVSILWVYTCRFRNSSNSRNRPVFLSLQ